MRSLKNDLIRVIFKNLEGQHFELESNVLKFCPAHRNKYFLLSDENIYLKARFVVYSK